jgi:3-phosphoshikimate 1-carboxyvinyltransferase
MAVESAGAGAGGMDRGAHVALLGTDVAPEVRASLIDEVPALAVAGAFASGELEITGASELRLKESDRIAPWLKGPALAWPRRSG